MAPQIILLIVQILAIASMRFYNPEQKSIQDLNKACWGAAFGFMILNSILLWGGFFNCFFI